MRLLTLPLLKPSDTEACSSHKRECNPMNHILLLVLVHGHVTRPAVRFNDIFKAMVQLPECHIVSLFYPYPLTHTWSTFSS